MDLNGKTAVVTGSARGIGFAMAELFASKGATAVISDIPGPGIEEAVKKIEEKGGKAIGIPCDVSKEEQVESLMKKIVDETGRLDVAVLNAGILRDGLLVKADRKTQQVVSKMTLAQWQAIIDVNLTGVFLSGREAAVQMVNCGNGGVIIPISSIARHGNAGQTNYSAAKAAVAALAVVWSKELARYKIRSAAIAPGFIATPMVLQDMNPAALEKFKKMIPIGRMGEPEEIAHTAGYIVENDMITGITIDVSGGIRL
ncbi:MAG TPA: short chain dehydrogenase [Desulfobacteraceae bacterium]|nr:short chain dehydrogenase [Desulfobacteraceae bacterium]